MSSAAAKQAAVAEALAAMGAAFGSDDESDSDEETTNTVANRAEAQAHQAESEPWATKHRPSSLDGVVGHTDAVETLRKNMLGADAAFPNLLFSGPCGTGKTTSILAAASDLYGSRDALRYMVLEVKASDQRGIGMVRNTLGEFTRVSGHVMSRLLGGSGANAPTRHLPRLVILDEADSMTPEAQSAMRAMMEENMDRVRFCLIVNRESGIQAPIFSRCLRLRFPPLARTDMVSVLQRIARLENVQCSDTAFAAMIDVADGDMRQAINIMQSCHMFASERTTTHFDDRDVYVMCGRAPPSETLTLLCECVRSATNVASVWSLIDAYMRQYQCSLLDLVLALYTCLLLPDATDAADWHQHWHQVGMHDETHVLLLIDELDRIQQRLLYITDPARSTLQAHALAATFTRCHHLAPPLADA